MGELQELSTTTHSERNTEQMCKSMFDHIFASLLAPFLSHFCFSSPIYGGGGAGGWKPGRLGCARQESKGREAGVLRGRESVLREMQSLIKR